MKAGRLFVAAAAAILASTPGARSATLYDQLGAKPGVEKLVATAATVFTSDPRIAAMFEDTNMDRFKQKLFEQLCQVSDGGCEYTGHDMKAAHKGLHLDMHAFGILVEDLQQAMDRNDIPFRVQNRLLARLAPMYRDVVTK